MKIYSVILALLSFEALSFPEMIKYGFHNCDTCHVNPTGGGLLNPTGRAISSKILSQSQFDGEEKFLYNALGDIAPSVLLGGDVRTLQAHRETSELRQGRFIVMQMDMEAAFDQRPWVVVASLGANSILQPPYVPIGRLISRRHYVIFYSPTYQQLNFKIGKFFSAYGLNIPEHMTSIRDGLDWRVGEETYHFESMWQNQSYDLTLAVNFGRPEEKIDRDKGFVTLFQFYPEATTKIGLSYYYGYQPKRTRHVFGPHCAIGINENLVLLEEIAFSHFIERADGHRSNGLANYSKLSYQIVKGLNLFTVQDYLRTQKVDSEFSNITYGSGAQYFPRPHWEFVLSAQRIFQRSENPQTEDLYYLMTHFYL